MSKNMTRKGLAFGAGFALLASGFASGPAQADSTGPMTLLPDGGAAAGATFTSIIDSGITLTGALDPRNRLNPVASTLDGNAYRYIVTNPDGADVTLDLDDSATSGWLVYNEDGATSTDGTDSSTTYQVQSDSFGTAGGTALFVSSTDATNVIRTNATKIVVIADVLDGNTSNVTDQDSMSEVKITTEETTAVSLTVQAVADADTAAATTTGIVGSFEDASDVVDVTLLPVGSVTATTSITAIDRNNGGEGETEGDVAGNIVLGNNVNPYAVDGDMFFTLFKDGSEITEMTDNNTRSSGASLSAKQAVETASAGKIPFEGFQANAGKTTAEAFTAGLYAAQAYLKVGSSYIKVGPASRVVDLTNGSVTAVDAATSVVDATTVSTANVAGSTDTVLVREGTESVTFTVTSTDGTSLIETADIEFRATATANKLSATSVTNITGSIDALAAKDDTAIGFARSVSSGKATFTVTNAGAVKGDKITIDFDVKDDAGVFSADAKDDEVTIEWQEAALTEFKAIPGTYVSGANPTVTLQALDQFGQAISSTDTGDLSVAAVALKGGVEDSDAFKETAKIVDGSVEFSFETFATATNSAQLKATLLEGTSTASVSVGTNPLFINVYNSADTDSVSVVDEYKFTITYKDYVTGDETDLDVAEALSDTGLDSPGTNEFQDITGTVLNDNSVGQPGVDVLVEADGMLFYDSAKGIYAEDSISVYSDEFGNFSVRAFAHEVNTTGHTATITADGVSTTTLLRTFLPDSLTGKNLQFSVSMPEEIAVNTTYAVVGSLTDKWGNPVATSTDGTTKGVTFQGAGSVEINSTGDEVTRNFGIDGTATVFVRSVKDILGPGSITATVNAAHYTYLDTSDAIQTATTNLSVGVEVVDVASTEHDETSWTPTVNEDVEVSRTVSSSSADAKVNAGSFKGFVAVYAKGYEGQRLSAKIGNDWVIVDPIVNNQENGTLFRVTDFTGAGVDIAVRIYIDRVLMDTINLTTK